MPKLPRTDEPFWVADATECVQVVRWNGGSAQADNDHVAREEPLEVRVNGWPLTTMMRTPGHDSELVTGLMLTEGVVERGEDLAEVRHCPDSEREGIALVRLRDGVGAVDLRRLQRQLLSASGCGLCGKATAQAVMAGVEHLPLRTQQGPKVKAGVMYGLPEALRSGQRAFALTGGLHAAGLFNAVGEAVVIREDIGRHNAVDKVIGWAARQASGSVTLGDLLLAVSGRAGFEIVQKAAVVGLTVVVGVSAPSSLAVALACQTGLTLVGFARANRANVYAGSWRILLPEEPPWEGIDKSPAGLTSVPAVDGPACGPLPPPTLSPITERHHD